MAESLSDQIRELERTISTLEAQRAVLGAAVVDNALAALRQQLAALHAQAAADAQRTALSELRRSAPRALADKVLAARSAVEGERKPVTILFTDIVGSTTYAEKLDPEEWREIVSGAHRRVSEAVYHYEGLIAQLLGDGVLAFFGAPLTHEDDPLRAVRAGLDIQHAIKEYAHTLEGYVDNFQMRIGIHSGTVVIGSIGSDLHMEYLAIGDAVNLAARLQSAAQPGSVLISAATARLVRAAVELKDLGELTVKGKAEPVHVFEAVAPKAVPSSGRGIEGLASPLVGRDAELEALQQALARLAAGTGQVVFVLGEAGIGKSRLVEEARRTVQDGEMRWLEGRALSYGQTLAFWTITQLLKADLGLSDADPEAKTKVALRRRLKALFGDRAEEPYPYLAHLLGINLEGAAAERLKQLDGETLKRQTLTTIADYFGHAAKAQPTVLIFEDLHWADPSSLQALEELLPLTDRAPLLLLLLARAEREHGSWQLRYRIETDYAHRYTELSLKPLSPADSDRLVNNLLEVANLPDTIRRMILERSEGNPFYLEEIVRSLIEQGAIVHDEASRTWRATREIADIEIPETLQGVLLARIDRLQEDVRRTLQLASVIGKSFLYRLLEAIAQAEQQLDQHLAQLQRADLVREKTRRPELEYMFKHSLTQEAAYNSLLVERRREFHRRVGEALEGLFADRPEEFYGLLAHHFYAAGERDKAVDYLIRAGDKTRREDAHAEAVGFYRRAIELLEEGGDPDLTARTWLKLGLTYTANFEFDAAHRAYEAAFALRQAHSTASRREKWQRDPARPLKTYRVESGRIYSDPAQAHTVGDWIVIINTFAAVAEIDEELNVVPHAARSWRVLDGGTRYLIHLRDDVQWTNGQPVTAADYEWGLKRVLSPALNAPMAFLLDEIVGAREYRLGQSDDPERIGVRALDPLTLEIRLARPVAYFPFLLSGTVPQPRAVIEQFGEDWWRPEHVVSCGAFRLVEWSEEGGAMERNPDYFGDFRGNLERVEWAQFVGHPARLQAYLEDRLDTTSILRMAVPTEMLAQVPPAEIHHAPSLTTQMLILLPRPPLDDVRVRRALVLAWDRQKWAEHGIGPGAVAARGGMVPPRMPGHSPDIGLPFDVVAARQLLAEAGLIDGKGMPPLSVSAPRHWDDRLLEALVAQWREHLGIIVRWRKAEGQLTADLSDDMCIFGWSADYPDPDSFLRSSTMYSALQRVGWNNARYAELVETAAHTTDRTRRMAMYREADRIWVNEQAVVCPFGYGTDPNVLFLQKPRVKHYRENFLGFSMLRDVIIE